MNLFRYTLRNLRVQQRRDMAEVQARGAEEQRLERVRAAAEARPLAVGGTSALIIARGLEASAEQDRAQDMGIQRPLGQEANGAGEAPLVGVGESEGLV